MSTTCSSTSTSFLSLSSSVDSSPSISSVSSFSSSSSLDQYLIHDIFARGSQGEVSLAEDKDTKAKVVIKSISSHSSDLLVRNEVRASQILGDHSYFARFRSYEYSMDRHHLIFDYEGVNLSTHLSSKSSSRSLMESEAQSIIAPVVSALKHAHSKSIAHMDVKLENILINEGKVTLIDFGLATFVEDARQLRREFPGGSDDYIPPEIVRRAPFNPFQCDVFSCGVVLFLLLFGCFPFFGLRTRQRATNAYARMLPKLKLTFPTSIKISRQAQDLLKQMLEDDPSKRITMKEAAKHKWFRMDHGQKTDGANRADRLRQLLSFLSNKQ